MSNIREVPDTELRDCEICRRAVNNFEWKQCRMQACAHSFSLLSPSRKEPFVAVTGVEHLHLTKPVQRRFLQQGGTRCPYCQSAVEATTEIEPINDLIATRSMRCKGHVIHEWMEMYQLTGVMTPEAFAKMYTPQPNPS